MNGSEKQIEWAEQIKKSALENNRKTGILFLVEREEEKLANAIEKQKSTADIELQQARLNDMNKIKTKIETCEDAKWFIDNRGEFNSMGTGNVEKLIGEKSEYRTYFAENRDALR